MGFLQKNAFIMVTLMYLFGTVLDYDKPITVLLQQLI